MTLRHVALMTVGEKLGVFRRGSSVHSPRIVVIGVTVLSQLQLFHERLNSRCPRSKPAVEEREGVGGGSNSSDGLIRAGRGFVVDGGGARRGEHLTRGRLERSDDVSANEGERAREGGLEFRQINGSFAVVRMGAEIGDALVDARQRGHETLARHRQHRVVLQPRRDFLPFGKVGEFVVDGLDQAAELPLVGQELLAGGMQLIGFVRDALVFGLKS